MKKVKFYRKLLFFLGIKELTEDIDLDFNPKTRISFSMTYLIILYILNQYFLEIFIKNVNIVLRVIILLASLSVFVESLYMITMKQYNSK
ncbi:hypothetical protein [Clostridium sp. LIBA-8841]|uniref:hypothetical protein n=1 Tax=Clostridium sp. LIBA-8841 TaxID=2987530 RepID=UPI002AC63899|nr:hypothetical protein [Clostridium sp. LIBA-8841]MDZ5253568.1 hypothetical protein [Clostridium sp. LIBA-8841]